MKIAGVDLELFESGDAGASHADTSHAGTSHAGTSHAGTSHAGTSHGRAVLFLHSGHGYDPWQPFADTLARQRRVIAPSHPGFGRSSLPDWLDSIDDIAYVYLELLDRLDLDRVDVVGCSIGGWIAAEMASKAPQRFHRLVLVGPAGVKVGSADKLDIPDLFAMPEQDVAKLVYRDPARMMPDMGKLPDDELAIVFRNRETLALLVWEPWMHDTKLKRRLHRIAAPTLFVRGEADGVISADYLAAYAKLLPNARTLTIPGAGHLPHLEEPQALASALHAFLEN
jgi:pimeloyl-ACP methyl ester carboxylesterase